MRTHYVYRITNLLLKKHYYGSRTTPDGISPQNDIGVLYFSSSRDSQFMLDQKNNPSNFKYKIVSVFANRQRALEFECRLHAKFLVDRNPSFYNKGRQSMNPGYIRHGEDHPLFNKHAVRAINRNSGKKCTVPMEQFLANPELVGVTYGKINVIDKINNCRIWIKNTEFDPSLHQHQNYKKVTARNIRTGENGLIPIDVFTADADWVGGTHGMVSAIDTDTGGRVYVTKEVFRQSDNLISSHSGWKASRETREKLSAMRQGMTTAKDKHGNTFRVHTSDIRFATHEIAGITAHRYAVTIPGENTFITLSLVHEFKSRNIPSFSYKLLKKDFLNDEGYITSDTPTKPKYPNSLLGWRIILLD